MRTALSIHTQGPRWVSFGTFPGTLEQWWEVADHRYMSHPPAGNLSTCYRVCNQADLPFEQLKRKPCKASLYARSYCSGAHCRETGSLGHQQASERCRNRVDLLLSLLKHTTSEEKAKSELGTQEVTAFLHALLLSLPRWGCRPQGLLVPGLLGALLLGQDSLRGASCPTSLTHPQIERVSWVTPWLAPPSAGSP